MTIMQTTMGCDCFWCFEASFQRLDGIIDIKPGFSGGMLENPSYDQVCTGKTGHAEVLRITYDDSIISFPCLLNVFFSIHNPTTLNRQGADIGSQYRSVIYYETTEQQSASKEFIADLNLSKKWVEPVVTELSPFTMFYPADQYHHNYFNKHPEQGYCQTVIQPKLVKLKQEHPSLLKP
ncbi:MAG: peptide-methionine (S)-S-oxide reductase MsrA [Methyloprofundus sp.]|nr:peptide-methionine (S)-S-oxide reductase MsrA [Methyloprofundus sp.]